MIEQSDLHELLRGEVTDRRADMLPGGSCPLLELFGVRSLRYRKGILAVRDGYAGRGHQELAIECNRPMCSQKVEKVAVHGRFSIRWPRRDREGET